MPSVTLDGVSKVFEGGAVAVDELSLEVADGEFMILVGSSGRNGGAADAGRGPRGASPSSRRRLSA